MIMFLILRQDPETDRVLFDRQKFCCLYICAISSVFTEIIVRTFIRFFFYIVVGGLQARLIPTGPDMLSQFGPGSGHFFFFYRSGSDCGPFSFSSFIVPIYAQSTHGYCMKY